jgi:hypothetical protein
VAKTGLPLGKHAGTKTRTGHLFGVQIGAAIIVIRNAR